MNPIFLVLGIPCGIIAGFIGHLAVKLREEGYRKKLGMGKECLIFNYVLENKDKLGYQKIYLYPTTDFDFLGVTSDGKVERVEIERSPREFLRHNHNAEKCDRVISLFNSKIGLAVPCAVLNKDDFAEFITRFNQQTKRLTSG